jgi:arsenate reductase (thioredoxin)
MDRRPLVLFVCSGNSARSIMAEALLRHHASDRFRSASAGMEPSTVNPLTLRVLAEIGVSTEGLRSKNTMEFLARESVHDAIIVCDRAQASCPRIQPFALRTHFWPFTDPVAALGTEAEKLAVFRDVRDQIDARIRAWLAEPPEH